jgi:hypothetical protein
LIRPDECQRSLVQFACLVGRHVDDIEIEPQPPSGAEVSIVWGEHDGGSRKPHVELHRQVTVGATVAPAPYAQAVRQFKAGTGKAAA